MKMNKFDTLTRYIPQLESGDFGKWIVDKENDGTPGHPIHFPFVAYSQVVHRFQVDLFAFCEEHPEYEHTRYYNTLEANGIDWGTESMENAVTSNLDAKAIIALLVGACRAERFCDGALLSFFKSGAIIRWLRRLQEMEEE